jgi:minor extracellular serine protease Vpr
MKSKRVGHGHMKWAVCSALLTASTLAAAAPREMGADGIARLQDLKLPVPIESLDRAGEVLHPSLSGLTGRQEVLVRLQLPSVGRSGGQVTRDQIAAEQAAFISRAVSLAPSTNVIASLQLTLNAVVLDVDAVDLPALAKDGAISRVVGVSNYESDLLETVPYIGASTAQALGARGNGVRIAVIDSGIDYTHADLGGPGTRAAYEAAWAVIPAAPPAIPNVPAGTGYRVIDDPNTTADDGLFPSAKVIGGFDFVGEQWTGAAGSPPLAPDPDPIPSPDATTNGGHGTHVADIIAGRNGVAPGALLYAVKSCATASSSCSGIALLQGIEYAVDPNGDGNPADKVDIINMSLGSPYGQPFDDDLSAAVDAASALGVLTVASAGNSADKQFITGSPGAATSALSVAQTSVPSGNVQIMTVLAPIAGERGAVFQPWSAPLTTTIEGPVFYPPNVGLKRTACGDATQLPTDPRFVTPFTPGELAGQIVLVDRGGCSFSLKSENIANAGGALAIIGLITPEVPFPGAFGGGVQPIPAFMINQADANLIRTGGVVRFSPTGAISLAGSLASTSSRGPRFDDNIVKPEISAPGASISAMSGSFTGTAAFGGTSGAAPMVTGAAAILKGARPTLSIGEIKQILVNTADTDVRQPSVGASVFPDQMAPITRIGGGEVRVDRALLSPGYVRDVTADEAGTAFGALSFGFLDASNDVTLVRKLRVVNTSGKPQSYKVTPNFRFQDDADSRAVVLTVTPASVSVPAGGSADLTARLLVKGPKLRGNLMSAGSGGNAIGPLTTNEYDGYIVFKGKDHKLTMPWHVLPRRASKVSSYDGYTFKPDATTGLASLKLINLGGGEAQFSSYSLLGTSPNIPEGGRGEQSPNPDLRAVGVNSWQVAPNVCGTAGDGLLWEFAFNTWERKASPVGTFLEVDLDLNGDNVVDYVILNRDLAGLTSLSDGRQVSAVLRVNAAFQILSTSIFFFAENATNTGNTVLRACANQLGLSLADVGRPITATFFASSWYFNAINEFLGPYVITPGGEQFSGATDVAILGEFKKTQLNVREWSLFPGTSAHQGLLVFTNSDLSLTNRGGATADTEALIFTRAP